MSESHNFEKHETPPSPSESIESVLERGEIEKIGDLLGYFEVKLVDIKGDGKALFKVSAEEFEEVRKKFFARIELELLAFELDKILGFNLVPPLVEREIGGKKGVFQKLMDARPIEMPDEYEIEDLKGWSDLVDNAEILKAAVFDYLIGAKDRHGGNFLLDISSRKIWLIDHDYLMYFQKNGYGSDLVRAAVNKNIGKISDRVRVALENLQSSMNELVLKFQGEATLAVLQGIKERTAELLQKGEIPIVNT